MSHQPDYRPASTNTLAVVSLIFGILAWCVLPFVGAIVAIICGHLARAEVRRSTVEWPVEGAGMALAGLVLGYTQLLLAVLAIGAFIALMFFGIALMPWHWG